MRKHLAVRLLASSFHITVLKSFGLGHLYVLSSLMVESFTEYVVSRFSCPYCGIQSIIRQVLQVISVCGKTAFYLVFLASVSMRI